MKITKYLLSLLVLLALQTNIMAAAGDDALGRWVTVDDKTGKQKSVMNLYKQGDKLFGKIEKLMPGAAFTECNKCKGADKGKPLVGLVLLKNMKFDGENWSGGTIMDPKNGKVYKSKLWAEGDKLKVRGYITFLYRTQTWNRVK